MSFIVVIGYWAHFAYRAFVAALLVLIKPGLWLKPLYDVLVGGLPLAVVLGIALGAVVWMQTRSILEKTPGASDLLPTVLAVAVVLELAPVGAGLIVAARTGASLGAELAAMKLGEQVDALELLGVSPMRRLVGPRVLACVIAVPLQFVLVAAIAMGSGYLAESTVGSTTWIRYREAAFAELVLSDVLVTIFKTFVFGALIGATGCFVGSRAKGGSEGVGRAATNSVVVCSLLVLAADVLLVGLFRVLI